MENIVECHGCGVKLKNSSLTLSGKYNSSPECYQNYSELSSYTMSKQDAIFLHQHAIDTYAAQHSGNGMKPITTAFSLIGIYYAVEKGFTGKQVQRVHQLLSHHKYDWPTLKLPDPSIYSLTVVDVLNAQPGESRDKMLRKWMEDVWKCWEHQHHRVIEICETLLK